MICIQYKAHTKRACVRKTKIKHILKTALTDFRLFICIIVMTLPLLSGRNIKTDFLKRIKRKRDAHRLNGASVQCKRYWNNDLNAMWWMWLEATLPEKTKKKNNVSEVIKFFTIQFRPYLLSGIYEIDTKLLNTKHMIARSHSFYLITCQTAATAHMISCNGQRFTLIPKQILVFINWDGIFRDSGNGLFGGEVL